MQAPPRPEDDREGWTHQEPVDVHDQEEQQQRVEEEIVRNAGHRLQAAVPGGVENLEWEPVEAEPEPGGGAVREAGVRRTTLPPLTPPSQFCQLLPTVHHLLVTHPQGPLIHLCLSPHLGLVAPPTCQTPSLPCLDRPFCPLLGPPHLTNQPLPLDHSMALSPTQPQTPMHASTRQ